MLRHKVTTWRSGVIVPGLINFMHGKNKPHSNVNIQLGKELFCKINLEVMDFFIYSMKWYKWENHV